VQTWDQPQLEIHARIEAGGTSAPELRRFEETTVDIQATSDSVRITEVFDTDKELSTLNGSMHERSGF